jgi:nicotinamidase-related amidase
MSEKLSIDRKHAAILIMDYMVAIVAGYVNEPDPFLARAAEILARARQAKVPVIYVKVGFRAGYPEVSPKNAAFSTVTQLGKYLPGDPGAEIHPAVAPRPDEVVIVKHRTGAFTATDLTMILRAKETDTLILLGIATSGVVLSTVRHAADADYRIFVVEDCCSDRDPDVHRCLVDKVFPRQATVVSAADLLASLHGD